MIKAILFDMDGTLVDSERYYTEMSYKWLCQYNVVDKKEIYKIVGLNMDDTYKTMSLLSGLSYDETKKSYDEYFSMHPMDYNDYLFDDVKDVLSKLSGYKLAICTLSSRDMLNKFISDTGLNEFDLLLSDEDVKNPKPSPDIYLKAIERLGVNRDETLVIEDSSTGIKAGKNAGICTLARDSSRFFVDQSEADYIFDDLHEVLNILNEKNI